MDQYKTEVNPLVKSGVIEVLQWATDMCNLDESQWNIIPGYGLTDTMRTTASSPEECQRICEENPTCRSVNYYPTTSDDQKCGINTKAWGSETGYNLISGDVDYYYFCFRPGR